MKKIIIPVTAALFFSLCGCASILLPYHENRLCEKGPEYGLCGSVSNVYKTVIKDPDAVYRLSTEESKKEIKEEREEWEEDYTF